MTPDPNAVPIRDGIADFTALATEIDIVGRKQIPLDHLKRAFHEPA
jgi:hypothetical protein